MSILNSLSVSPAIVFSLRKLVDTYNGSAIRVRRSSDNTEQDIGFDGIGNLDTSALSTFVGSNSGYVKTWYDQTTNGYNATNITQGEQPRIVNAGTIETEGLYFNASMLSFTKPSTVATMSVIQKTTDTAYIVCHGTPGGNYFSYMAYQYNSNTAVHANFGTPTYFKNGTQQTWTNRGVVYTELNNAKNIVTAVSCSMSTWQATINIGKYDAGFAITGYIPEFMLFSTALSATDRRYLETNQGDYYNITTANDLYPVSDITVSGTPASSNTDASTPTVSITAIINSGISNTQAQTPSASIIADILAANSNTDMVSPIQADSITVDINPASSVSSMQAPSATVSASITPGISNTQAVNVTVSIIALISAMASRTYMIAPVSQAQEIEKIITYNVFVVDALNYTATVNNELEYRVSI